MEPLALPFQLLRERFPESAQARRAEQILELLISVQDGIEDTWEWWWGSAKTKTALKKLLDRYHFKFSISFSASAGEISISTSIDQADKKIPRTIWSMLSGQELEDFLDALEYSAVEEAMKLVGKPGGLARVRRCETCEQIFFALKRTDQKYCTNVCRQWNYDNDPERRKQRLAKMRENYASATGRENRNKERIGYVALRKKSAKKPR